MKKLVFIYLVIACLLAFSIFFDEEISQFIVGLRMPFLNDFLIWISYGGTWFVVLFIMTSLFLWNEKKRKWIMPLWLSLGISAGLVYLLKIIVARERPYEALGLEMLVEKHGESFPSGHANAVFSTLGVLDKEFPKFKWFWFGFALLVAFSRVYLGLHYLSDVVVGGAIGFSIGLLVVHFWEKINISFRK